ncbi:MAG: putative sulfate/molybdate transporter [Armatimonadota bacterium]|nr:putative sulfate/molybdate transporter [Armatimonadota bacterium]MDR7452083.1 putative sulfate/molybdate transporter [Armatimonadota bacterium]MDR7466545.1 putative sulfate/molybdate transporter [Armatimonadota bacterium]MDR7493267.1 putative sulfate/molybdate transporter [Armatimonadota bacterium]MDR7499840.1 putative sulfate/molybdate transporter [Armatimonadota bacterium]
MPQIPLLRAVPRTGPASIRFDRNELAGAFGDIGTDLPLIVGMILAAGLDSASVLTMFGIMQIATGLIYRMPMPAQPLKAMAAIVISRKLAAGVLYGGGLAVGLIMLLLVATGLLTWLARVIPLTVIRGIQFGLGLQLASLALRDYVLAEGLPGYLLAAAAFLIVVLLLGNRRFPAALFVIACGVVYAFGFTLDAGTVARSVGFRLPAVHLPATGEVLTGLVLLALPQIPLSLGNSVLATWQTARDLMPERPITLRKIGATYAAMNLLNPFLSGIPTCHGSGGLVGHYTFGARTGGSVVMYGLLYVILGLFFSGGFDRLIHVFPLPMLGVLLLFEGLGLMALVGRLDDGRGQLRLALLLGLIAGWLPYGYLLALGIGPLLVALDRYRGAGGGPAKTPR